MELGSGAVRYQWGQDVILVSSDGLEFENSQGSYGIHLFRVIMLVVGCGRSSEFKYMKWYVCIQ